MWEISSFGLRSTVSSAEAGRSIEINQDLKLVVKSRLGCCRYVCRQNYEVVVVEI